MGAVCGIINFFKYINNNNEIETINLNYDDSWENVKTNNSIINSIFDAVDNGDGIIQAEELNKLNKIMLYIDKFFKKNEVLETEELNMFQENLNSGKIDLQSVIESECDTGVKNWSEGLDRNISKISVAEGVGIKDELIQIGEEQGFIVEEIDSNNDMWIEDSRIRRADGMSYMSYHDLFSVEIGNGEFVNESNYKNAGGGARVISDGSVFNLDVEKSSVYYASSYLEGGNVLNTVLKDGSPAAIVGESSIAYTLDVLKLENTPENVIIAKKTIAQDLGLDLEKVTFIPQYDFHIDMIYHPLHDGQIAVPDYYEGICILLNNDIEGMSHEEKVARARKLIELKNETESVRQDVEQKLIDAGYELVKIPCFTLNKDDQTNFMNGVGGTSKKTGQSFFITNKSEFPALENIIEKYFKEAGIDKVYFVSTESYLKRNGGIDCLTQEE